MGTGMIQKVQKERKMFKSQKLKEEAEVCIPSTRKINQINMLNSMASHDVLAVKECRSGISIHMLSTKSLDHHYSLLQTQYIWLILISNNQSYMLQLNVHMECIRHHMLYDLKFLLTVVDIQMTANHNSSLRLWVH